MTINGNLYWKRGRIDLKSKRLNSFMVNNSSLRWQSMHMFDFNSIPPSLQQWLPIITLTSKIQCRMVIPQVPNRWESIAIFYLNSMPSCLKQWLPTTTETSKIPCRMVIPQVLDENRGLFLILTRFLYVFSEDNG